MRGLSAILVLLGHVRALLFLRYDDQVGLLGKVFYFVTGFGHQAVIVFFVLSGFFIVKSVHEAVGKSRWRVLSYGLNRISRLWVVLVPSLLLTAIWDTLGLIHSADFRGYSGMIEYMPDISPLGRLNWSGFIGNLLFLQGILTPTFGSNAALWSLANEFWYYTMFPLIYFAFVNSYSRGKRVLFLLLFVLCCVFIGFDIAIYFGIWLMGGVSYFLMKEKWRFRVSWLRWSVCIVFVAMLIVGRLGALPVTVSDFLLGTATAGCITLIASNSMRGGLLKTLVVRTSDMSYTIYLSHLSFSLFLSSVFFAKPLGWGVTGGFIYIVTVVVVISYCFVIYWLFERNTALVKAALATFINSKKSPGP